MGLLPNRLCDEKSKFRAKISKRDDMYLAKIHGGVEASSVVAPKYTTRVVYARLLPRFNI